MCDYRCVSLHNRIINFCDATIKWVDVRRLMNGRWNFHIIWIIFITLQTFIYRKNYMEYFLKIFKWFSHSFVIVDCATTHVHLKYNKNVQDRISIRESFINAVVDTTKKNFAIGKMSRYFNVENFYDNYFVYGLSDGHVVKKFAYENFIVNCYSCIQVVSCIEFINQSTKNRARNR